MLVTVYDPDGQMFEVTPDRLDDLIVKRGWTFEHPSKSPETVLGIPYVTAARERQAQQQEQE